MCLEYCDRPWGNFLVCGLVRKLPVSVAQELPIILLLAAVFKKTVLPLSTFTPKTELPDNPPFPPPFQEGGGGGRNELYEIYGQ